MSLFSAIAGNIYMAVRPIILEYCNCKCIEYVKIKSDPTIHNRIMGNCLENIISNNWIALCVNLFTIFFFLNGFTGHAMSLIPPAVLGFVRFGTDCWYAVSYRSEFQCKSDISYLEDLYDQNHIQRIYNRIKGIKECEIISERQRIVEFLVQRSKLDEVIKRLGLVRIVKGGIPDGMVVRNNDDINTLHNG